MKYYYDEMWYIDTLQGFYSHELEPLLLLHLCLKTEFTGHN